MDNGLIYLVEEYHGNMASIKTALLNRPVKCLLDILFFYSYVWWRYLKKKVLKVLVVLSPFMLVYTKLREGRVERIFVFNHM